MYILKKYLGIGFGLVKDKLFKVYTKVYVRFKHPRLILERNVEFDFSKHVAFNLQGNNRIFSNANLAINTGGGLHLSYGAWIGNNVQINSTNVAIGRYSGIHAFGTINGDVSIGDYVMIAKNVFISSGTHHHKFIPEYPIKLQDRLYQEKHGEFSKKITIEDDVWIGANCVIMPGVTVSKGVVIGAGSVVNTDLEPYAVYAGAPAKKISSRLSFIPPLAISAKEVKDWPYFYSGVQFDNGRLEPFPPQSSLKIFKNFSLVLGRGSGPCVLFISIKALSPGMYLSFLGAFKEVETELTELIFDIPADFEGNRLEFELTGVAETAYPCAEIIFARIEHKSF